MTYSVHDEVSTLEWPMEGQQLTNVLPMEGGAGWPPVARMIMGTVMRAPGTRAGAGSLRALGGQQAPWNVMKKEAGRVERGDAGTDARGGGFRRSSHVQWHSDPAEGGR